MGVIVTCHISVVCKIDRDVFFEQSEFVHLLLYTLRLASLMMDLDLHCINTAVCQH